MTVTVERLHENIAISHDLIQQFETEYADVLPAVSAEYFHANERLTDRQRAFVQALLHVGSSVNSIAAEHIAHMQNGTQLIEYRDDALQHIESIKERVNEMSDSYHQQFTLLKQYANQQNMPKREFKALHDDILEVYQKNYNGFEQLYSIKRDTASRYHDATYGAAFRKALQDVGVEFVDGAAAFHEKVQNAVNLRGIPDFVSDHESAMSTYPAVWVERVNFPLNVYVSPYLSEGVVHVEKYGNTVHPVMISSDYTTSVHEWGHILEIANPMIGRAERLFLMFEREVTGFGAVQQHKRNQYIVTDSLADQYSAIYYRGRRTVTIAWLVTYMKCSPPGPKPCLGDDMADSRPIQSIVHAATLTSC